MACCNSKSKPYSKLISIWKFVGVVLLTNMLLFFCSCGSKPPYDDHTVAKVDLKKYIGVWYEIASFPAPFQKDCLCTKAEYLLKKDHIQVINSCKRSSPDNEWDQAIGKAWPVENSNNSRLKVSFFWPFKGDYWVVGLDKKYQWVLVGHPERKYLWIMARTPKISQNLYLSLVQKAKSLGYDVTKLKLMSQVCANKP